MTFKTSGLSLVQGSFEMPRGPPTIRTPQSLLSSTESAVSADSSPAPELVHANQVARLNVGGVHFSTFFDTLANCRSPFFSNMCRVDAKTGRIFLFKQHIIEDDEGRIFINRDGQLFHYVLQYMRDGKRAVIPESRDLILQLVREAEFFAFERWRSMLLAKLKEGSRQTLIQTETLDAIRAATQRIAQLLHEFGGAQKSNNSDRALERERNKYPERSDSMSNGSRGESLRRY
ncbi:hypothetical protein AB6A40_002578 [Gnathostoma spinigerum]|uniref:BTB domain-containing protein n=1 Tax=Gnathostoma spinigerum TaxID=75299 RepID=A0ABD6E6Y8_9BILA